MAILIKGMEMPDSCFLCRFCRRQEYGEYVGEDTAWSCVASKKRITDGQDLIATFKHPDCPLVEAAEVKDAVSRQEAIEAINTWDKFGVDERCRIVRWHKGLEPYVHLRDVLTAIVNLPSVQLEKLTDKEQRIFLSAMGREEKVCEEVDRNYVREPYEDSLMYVCKEIKRKVKGALWTL